MKLSLLHALEVRDQYPITEENKEDKDKDKKGSGLGTKKNEQSPAAKAYKATGLSQDEIADKAGVDKSTISRYKSKDPDIQRTPSVKTLKSLANKANVSVKQMLPDLL
jgi:ribosome-binding protein aMBF1 (putative translation factor)